MLTQKLYKNGNSVAVTIPKVYLRELGLRDGSRVVVKKHGGELIVSPGRKKLARGVNPEFMEMVDEFMEEHKDVLQKLAKR